MAARSGSALGRMVQVPCDCEAMDHGFDWRRRGIPALRRGQWLVVTFDGKLKGTEMQGYTVFLFDDAVHAANCSESVRRAAQGEPPQNFPAHWSDEDGGPAHSVDGFRVVAQDLYQSWTTTRIRE